MLLTRLSVLEKCLHAFRCRLSLWPHGCTFNRSRSVLYGCGIRGSYLCGVAAQIAVDKWIKTTEKHFLTLETKFTAAYSRGPVSTNFIEYSVVPNYAVHVILGVGNKPTKPKSIKDAVKTFSVPSLYMGGVGFLIKTIDAM